MRYQRPIGNGKKRVPTLGCLDPAIRKWAEREAHRYAVTPSFVLNTALSFVSGIELEHESYRQIPYGVKFERVSKRMAKSKLRMVHRKAG